MVIALSVNYDISQQALEGRTSTEEQKTETRCAVLTIHPAWVQQSRNTCCIGSCFTMSAVPGRARYNAWYEEIGPFRFPRDVI